MTEVSKQNDIIEVINSEDSNVDRDIKTDGKTQEDDIEKLAGEEVENTERDANSNTNLSLYQKFKIRVPRHTL